MTAMQFLKSQTDEAWILAATGDVDALLIDHAHCEHKAAVSALALVSRYPHDPLLVEELSALAVEEASHLQRVSALVHARGKNIGHPSADPYAKGLLSLVRSTPLEHMIDRLLVCALIEARSCERLRILSERLDDDFLRVFYRELFQAEAKHAVLFVDLAVRALARETVAPENEARPRVMARLDTLAVEEARIVDALPRLPKIH
jgi:tRNA-(ms[2]io[6]A)-hydroxylase